MRGLPIYIAVTSVLSVASAEERGIGSVRSDATVESRKYAVIIGINAYEDESISDLEYAVADARAVHQMLSTAPGGFDAKRMVLLTDDAEEGRKPNLGTVLRYLRSYVTLAGSDDTVLVYFAGHAMTLEDRLHLLPADVSRSLISRTGISFADLSQRASP